MKTELLNAIENACDDAIEPGWCDDGDCADPVSESTYLLAKLFVQALPDDLPAPQRVVVSPNGGIDIEWCPHTPQRAVYVRIDDNGIDWAAIDSGEPRSGDVYPPDCSELAELIRRIAGDTGEAIMNESAK